MKLILLLILVILVLFLNKNIKENYTLGDMADQMSIMGNVASNVANTITSILNNLKEGFNNNSLDKNLLNLTKSNAQKLLKVWNNYGENKNNTGIGWKKYLQRKVNKDIDFC